jgi:hypothetical protein
MLTGLSPPPGDRHGRCSGGVAGTELSRPTPTRRPAAPVMINAAIKIRDVQRNARAPLLVALLLPVR